MRFHPVRTPAVVIAVALLASIPAASDAQPDSAATIRVLDRQGEPLGEARVFVTVKTDAYDPVRLVDGKLSADGTFEVPWPDDEIEYHEFIVNVGARNFEVGRFDPPDERPEEPIEFTMPPRAGDAAPDIAMVHLFSNEPATLSDFRGQVVLLDFWASWCAPCQEPMAHNQDVMTRRAADWDGKATIVALSIDAAQQDAADHIRAKGWTAIDNYWSADGPETGWNSDAPRTYGIDGIPTALLIGPDGEVLWRGHPGQKDIEKLIDDALAGPDR